MTREDLRKAIAAGADLSPAGADRVIQAFIDAVTRELAAGRDVSLQDFGKFDTRTLAARASRNPQTGAPIVAPAEVYTVFSPSQLLFDELN